MNIDIVFVLIAIYWDIDIDSQLSLTLESLHLVIYYFHAIVMTLCISLIAAASISSPSLVDTPSFISSFTPHTIFSQRH